MQFFIIFAHPFKPGIVYENPVGHSLRINLSLLSVLSGIQLPHHPKYPGILENPGFKVSKRHFFYLFSVMPELYRRDGL